MNGRAVDDDNDSGSEKPQTEPKAKPQIPMVDLDRMVADSLRDIDMDEDDGDDDDQDLLKELSEIMEPKETQQNRAAVPPQSDLILPTTDPVPDLIKTRIQMYKTAEENAKAADDSSRARRLGRGLETLETISKQVLAGKAINMEDIPLEVITKITYDTPALTPVRSAPAPPTVSTDPVVADSLLKTSVDTES